MMALTLWKRVLLCVRRLLEVLSAYLGDRSEEIAESMVYDEKAADAYFIMAKALEGRGTE